MFNPLDALLDTDLQQQQFLNQMKKQEQLTMQAVIQAKKGKITEQRNQLKTFLPQAATDMKTYASTTYIANIKEGFEGKTAEKAQEYLSQGIKKPDLQNPIRK